MNYKAMYFHLFNAATDAIEAIDRGSPKSAREILVEVQRETEEMYLSLTDTEPIEVDPSLRNEELCKLLFPDLF